jgi:hypothetical protein
MTPSAADYAAPTGWFKAMALLPTVVTASPGDRCSLQCALSVAREQNCHLNREMADRYIAETATARSNQAPCDIDRSAEHPTHPSDFYGKAKYQAP